jgi:hypothetical protein
MRVRLDPTGGKKAAVANTTTASATAAENGTGNIQQGKKPPRPYSFRSLTGGGGGGSKNSNNNDSSKAAPASNGNKSNNCSSAHSTATGDFSVSEGSDEHELPVPAPSMAATEAEALDDSLDNDSLLLDYDQDLVAVDDRPPPPINPEDHAGQHPALQSMCVINTATSARIVPNGPPAVLENDCFYGHVMLLVRTPDVDEADDQDHHYHSHSSPDVEATMGEIPKAVSAYFRGKKRRFEFQFQIRLKKVPQGALFLGCELEHAIRVGTITKGLVGILLAMVRRINPGFHYSWGEQDTVPEADRASGNYEKTHLSFPVEASMDRIVVTKPGDVPPHLGQELIESVDSVKRRRKMGVGSVDWNTEDVFTMCLWSAYADWIKWKSLNVPGVAPFSLCRVTGTQPIYLSVYEITSCPAQDYKKKRPPHKRRDLKVYARLEFTNDTATRGGMAERVLGRSSKFGLLAGGGVPGDNMSLPDTESVDSDFETTSRVTCT